LYTLSGIKDKKHDKAFCALDKKMALKQLAISGRILMKRSYYKFPYRGKDTKIINGYICSF